MKLHSATKRRWLAYDHVTVVADTTVSALYVSRGRPDMWKPETKKAHRRKLLAGVWACRQPKDASDDEFWAARRDIHLVEAVSNDAVVAHSFVDEQMKSGMWGAPCPRPAHGTPPSHPAL